MKIKQDTVIAATIALLLGIILGGLAGNQGLFGTAADTGEGTGETLEVDPNRFYLVTFEEAQNWLVTKDTTSATNLQSQLSDVAGLANAASALDLGQYFSETEESVNTVLFSLQGALLTEEGVTDSTSTAVTTCIGVDSDPYNPSGPGLYVYVEVPEGVEVPDEFEDNTLTAPRDSSITWAATCVTGKTDDK